MGYINRFLLFIYALVIALASLGLGALCFHILPEAVIQNEVAFALSRWETIAGAVVVFLWSVHLMGCSLSRSERSRGDAEAIILLGAAGEVRISVSAVRDMAEKSALAVPGVYEAKAKVRAQREKESSSVAVTLSIAVDAKQNVAEISDSIRKEAHRQLTDILGVKDFTLEVFVTELRQPIENRKRVN